MCRSVLVGAVAALITDSFVRGGSVPAIVVLAAVALYLDAVDGRVARRTRTASPVGAIFDQEIDAFLILVLSVYVANSIGLWVLAIGLARYAYLAAGFVLPWLREPLPPRYWGKVVAAIQGVVLTVAVANFLPTSTTVELLAVALALLAESFGRSVWWLWREHRSPQPATPAVPSGQTETPAWLVKVRTGGAWGLTVLAFLVVWFALVAPNQLYRITPGAFVRIPVEGLVLVAICLYLPVRVRQVVAVVVGVLLGMLTIVKLLDVGWYVALDRPFSPVTDWGNFKPALGVLRDSIGNDKANAAEALAILLVLTVLVVLPLALLRLTRLTSGHRAGTSRAVPVLGLVWIVCISFGVQVGGAQFASRNAAALTYDHIDAVRSDLKDQRAFESALKAPDPISRTPSSDLLTKLRGKDVLVVFIESYGEVAVRGSSYSPSIDSVLKTGTKQLGAAGFSARSAFLTSPTFGGISWLAHSTLQSGLWINNQTRYNQLVKSTRYTLSDAFKNAGWRTVSDEAADDLPWPEGKSFYHYDKLYNSKTVGYKGPKFSYAPVPDQYTYAAFQRLELQPKHKPVMAEIVTVSSHAPWTPLPHTVPADKLGDGSIYDGMPQQGQSPSVVWRDSQKVKDVYGQSIRYSLHSLFSFIENSHDKNLVVVTLGDHQPGTTASGPNASHQVPISIIAHDPKVMASISSWNWQDGLLPDPHAPVWPMDAFRNRFLTAFDQPATSKVAAARGR
jgi:phosphatidylglycerophosphate synthase